MSKDSPYTGSDLYIVLVEPKRGGEVYAPETEWPDLIRADMALVSALAEPQAIRILRIPAEAIRDVSEDMARDALRQFREQGRTFKSHLMDVPEFIGRHLYLDEIVALSHIEPPE